MKHQEFDKGFNDLKSLRIHDLVLSIVFPSPYAIQMS